MARRSLPGGSGPPGGWQTVELAHQLSTNDSHIGMDSHNNAIYYVKSEAGLVSDPGNRSWVAGCFGAVHRSLDGVTLGNITYPRFVLTPENRLQLSYRTGGSGNGTMELAEYDNLATGAVW